MSTKNKTYTAKVIAQVKTRYPFPTEVPKDLDLLELGMVFVLMRRMSQTDAIAVVKALGKRFEDWNEARVSQYQEIYGCFPKVKARPSRNAGGWDRETADAVKTYLQEVFQETHGLSLEFLADDPGAGGELIEEMTFLGLTGGSYLLYVAGGGEIPVHKGLIKILDRLGLITRTTSMKKARDMISKITGKDAGLGFTLAFHEIIDRWGDAEEPSFVAFPILQDAAYGKKAFKDWTTQRERLEAQRKREEERQRKEDERERKRVEAEDRKREREHERKRKDAEKKRKAMERQREAQNRKMDAVRAKHEAARKKKAATQAKKSSSKEASGKKASGKKASGKKAAAKKSSATKTSKKAPAKSTATKKASKVTKKTASKKTVTKKVAKKAAKKATKKKAVKKAPAKKAAKKAPAKKAVKKAAKKAAKKASKKKAAGRR